MFAVFFLLFAVLCVIVDGAAAKAKPTHTPTVAPNPNLVTYDSNNFASYADFVPNEINGKKIFSLTKIVTKFNNINVTEI